jgi:hypothetical protein
MSDTFRPHTNPEAFENETLGEATTTPFLDQVEAQYKEDFNARHAGREARTVVAINRVPGKFISSSSVPSSVRDELVYEGELSTSVDDEDFTFEFSEDTDGDSK